MDRKILELADLYREKFGETIINSPWNRVYSDSGFRSISSFKRMKPNKEIQEYDDWGSAHPRGKAIDCKPNDKSADETFENILDNSKWWYGKGLRRLEAIELTNSNPDNPNDGWNHLDVIETDHNDLIIVTNNPVNGKYSFTVNEYKQIRNQI